jgi:mono/diheme cytochrome c family protein
MLNGQRSRGPGGADSLLPEPVLDRNCGIFHIDARSLGWCSVVLPTNWRLFMFRAVHFVVVALMLTCAVAPTQAGQAVERGRQVYAAEKCSVCHAIAGTGNKRGSLDGVGAKLSADEIRQWLVNAAEMAAKTKATRKPVMKSYGHLAKDDVDALVALMQTLK